MTTHAPSRMPEPEEPHGVFVPPPHHEIPYGKVFAALMVLTIITVAIGIYLRFQNELVNVMLALLVAAIKGTLVARFFMHLKYEGKLIYLILISPLVLCVILIVALLPDILPVGESSMTIFDTPSMYQPSHGDAALRVAEPPKSASPGGH